MTTEYDVLVKCFRAQLKKAEEEFRWVTTPQSKQQKPATGTKMRLIK